MIDRADANPAQDRLNPSRRERKKRELRQRIFDAAFQLFLEHGFEKTTVEQIAARADVGKGTVFNYFPRKQSFLAAVADDWIARLTEELGSVDQWLGSTREQLERVFRFLTELGVRNPALSRLAFSESLRYMGGAPSTERLTAEPPVRQLQAITRTVLREGQRAGEIQATVNLEYAAVLIESAFFRTLARWLRDGGPTDALQEEISAKLDIIFDGVAVRGGRTADTGGS